MIQEAVIGLLVLLIAFYLLLDGQHLWQMGLHLIPAERRMGRCLAQARKYRLDDLRRRPNGIKR